MDIFEDAGLLEKWWEDDIFHGLIWSELAGARCVGRGLGDLTVGG